MWCQAQVLITMLVDTAFEASQFSLLVVRHGADTRIHTGIVGGKVGLSLSAIE